MNRVTTVASINKLCACAVGEEASIDVVITCSAVQAIIAGAAVQVVVISATIHGVVAFKAQQNVITSAAVDDVVTAFTIKCVASAIPVDGVVVVTTFDTIRSRATIQVCRRASITILNGEGYLLSRTRGIYCSQASIQWVFNASNTVCGSPASAHVSVADCQRRTSCTNVQSVRARSRCCQHIPCAWCGVCAPSVCVYIGVQVRNSNGAVCALSCDVDSFIGRIDINRTGVQACCLGSRNINVQRVRTASQICVTAIDQDVHTVCQVVQCNIVTFHEAQIGVIEAVLNSYILHTNSAGKINRKQV